MAKLTSALQVAPWVGGLNTSTDPGFLQPGELTAADNIIFDYDSSKRRRDGINYNWDNATAGSAAVVGGIDYWFGTSDSKAQFLISVLADGKVYRTSGGIRTLIVDMGSAWTVPLTEANLEVFNNRVIIAVSGVNNQMKFWDGNPANGLMDLPSLLYNAGVPIASTSRSSSGTTRTVVFNNPVTIANGQPIIISGGPATYNGSYTLLSGTGTTTITYTAGTSLTEASTTTTAITIGGRAPLALYVREHAGRLVTNDKTRLDYLMYSEVGNHTVWGGNGTSGGFAISQGDGDPNGITGISPTYRGDLFVGKRTKLYRIPQTGDFDFASVIKVSDGIGFLSHQAIVSIDQDDILFISDRGFHSLQATNAYGDFSAAFISTPIQRSFVQEFEPSRKRYIKGAYLPEINSVCFAVSERGSSVNNSMWLFNLQLKYWFRWPGVSAETLIAAQDSDKRRVYLGNANGRLAQSLTGLNQDVLSTAALQAISSKVTTGVLWLDNRQDTVKGLKRVMIIYRASGSYSITAKIKIDNFAEQGISFVSSSNALPLGVMVLGHDVLGGSFTLAPYSLPVDGYGRGVTLSVEQSDLNTALAVQGFLIEFEGGADSPETRQSDNS